MSRVDCIRGLIAERNLLEWLYERISNYCLLESHLIIIRLGRLLCSVWLNVLIVGQSMHVYVLSNDGVLVIS
jgi:hypothetical protein